MVVEGLVKNKKTKLSSIGLRFNFLTVLGL